MMRNASMGSKFRDERNECDSIIHAFKEIVHDRLEEKESSNFKV